MFPDFFRYLDSVVGCIAELFTPLLIRPSVPVHTIGHICHPNPNRTSPQPNTHHVTRSFSKHIIPKYVPSLINPCLSNSFQTCHSKENTAYISFQTYQCVVLVPGQ